jgi:hypothetical protein
MTYTITGWTTGGWDVVDHTNSLKAARAMAKTTMGGFSADSGSHVAISKDGLDVIKWSGTTAGRWIRVTV